MKKICLKILFFYLITTSIPIPSCAVNNNLEPTINARHAIVFDRNSKTSIYEKEINEKCKMASTTNIVTT